MHIHHISVWYWRMILQWFIDGKHAFWCVLLVWEIGIFFFKVLHELDQCAGGHRLYIRENVVCLFIEYRSMFWGWPKLPLVGCIFAHNPFHYLVKAEQENITFWLKYSNMSVEIWSVVHVRHNCMWMKCIQNLVFFCFFLQIVGGRSCREGYLYMLF